VPADFQVARQDPDASSKRRTDGASKDGGRYRLGHGRGAAPSARSSFEGTPVRLSGQDCERGTFTHRHAVLDDAENREKYHARSTTSADSRRRSASTTALLSEVAVLGFDYGYSLD